MNLFGGHRRESPAVPSAVSGPAGLRADGVAVHVDTGRWAETVVSSATMAVAPGELVVLIGESGCGKSMLGMALAGRLPAAARVVDGAVSAGAALDALPVRLRLAVGYTPQDGVRAFDAGRSVGDQLAEVAHSGNTDPIAACAEVGYPSDAADLLPSENSGGQIQRAAVAAALLTGCLQLVIDEPSASLDLGHAHRMWAALRRRADEGAAVLVISHDLPIILKMGVADRLVVMRDGATVSDASPTEMAASTDNYISGFFRAFGG
ncbi:MULTISPECIES: ATP-binding cassette domain-containing protein [Tsukamurella]|uniref:ATP-binding cassette domain-containing protein n=2 Tax=Tsukamurella TaxID=2060 RepID=A0A5C5RZ17_9ACTN|nr:MULTISPECIES: ATP-binding cassette domain-containing protein [Tsukamurella]NMD55488.1 ATP-binding cassette domain-containing protein [Tsukamurella columbiensis]TWS28054.1 ATP-binding cassette domain-containing protein [Tsukamurella conjunctivitidis]